MRNVPLYEMANTRLWTRHPSRLSRPRNARKKLHGTEEEISAEEAERVNRMFKTNRNEALEKNMKHIARKIEQDRKSKK